MDALIAALNQRVSNKITQETPLPDAGRPAQSFSDVLDSKRSTLVMDKISSEFSAEKGDIKVLPASDIELANNNFDVQQTNDINPKQKITELFSGLNDNMNSLDASIEVLSDPNVKLSRRQLLAYQAGIGQLSIMTELSSKVIQSVSTAANQILSTNIS